MTQHPSHTGSLPGSLTLRLDNLGVALVCYSPFGGEAPRYEWFNMPSGGEPATGVRRALESSLLAGAGCRSVNVLVQSAYTLVPLRDFREEEADDIFHYNFPRITRHTRVHYDILPGPGAALVFGLDALTEDVLAGKFGPGMHVACTTSALTQHFMERCRTARCARIFAYAHGERLCLTVFRDGKLQLANRYLAKTCDDAAYFTLRAFKQLGFSDEHDEVFVVCDGRETQDRLIEMLRGFVPNVYPINPRGEFNRHPLTKIENLSYDQLIYMLRQY